MELRQLKYFVAVAEELHFRRAAERLYVAQPAVSEQIRKLEAELGVRLFDRTNRSVAITEAGTALLEEGRRVLAQADVAQLAARNARDSTGARLRIGHLPDVLPASVPRALEHLGTAMPRVAVGVETGTAAQLAERVRDRRLDVAVVSLPAPAAGLQVTSLGRDGMVAAVAASAARAVGPEAGIAQLAPERLVALPRAVNPAFHDAVVALCRDAGIAPDRLEVAEPRLESLLLAVAAGNGVAVLPAAAAARCAVPGIRLIELQDRHAWSESAVLTRPDAESLATGAFLRAVAAAQPRPALTLAA